MKEILTRFRRAALLSASSTLLIGLLTACGPDLPEAVAIEYANLPGEVDFNQHIRPILSDRCWSCHGPDAEARQADLRLDQPMTKDGPGWKEVAYRVLSDDPEIMMPVPESHLSLTDREKALLVRWIEDGAEWKDHWAFLPIEDPELPDNPEDFPAARTGVDNFVHSRLNEEGLTTRGPAQNETLLRRLYLDLTGLPPSLEAIDAWLADPSDEAYAAKVDELLDTDAFAERMTMEWLDVARYADSHGMHADGIRTSHPYRDWLISAFRRNLPFDTFIRYQLAGDLLPEPTRESVLATAFLRMHPMTAEGGVIDEEFRLSYVFDRVNTVATGFLGLTMDCARCHDHKFDPLSQEEYYGFSAFFNTMNELGMTGDDGDYGPVMVVSDPETEAKLQQFTEETRRLDQERASVSKRKSLSGEELEQFLAKIEDRPDFYLPFDAFAEERLDRKTEGTESFAVVVDEERGRVGEFDHPYDIVSAKGQATGEMHEPLSGTVWINTQKRDSSLVQTIMGTTSSKNEYAWRGMELYLDTANRLTLRLVHRLPDDLIEVQTMDSLRIGQWYQVGFSYDGSGVASGVQLYLNGGMPEVTVLHDALTGSFDPVPCPEWMGCDHRPLRIGRAWRTFTGDDGVFKGRMDELKLYNSVVSPVTVAREYKTSRSTREDESMPPTSEDPILTHLQRSDAAYRRFTEQLRKLQAKRWPYADTIAGIMVAREMQRPRATYVLDRGAYDAPGKEVTVNTPAKVLPWSQEYPQNRLGLAQWLTSEDNPLTSRVLVNRYWQLFFGRGLMDTPHDFGSQGSLPTHPRLLDYLAASFREHWDLRELVRLIVLSDTYRRSSTPTEEQQSADPENLLLARGPRFRLPAELIRDNALAASGLLNDRVGGQSVKPYQPKGLWIEKSQFSHALLNYVPDSGDKLYRRSMYTFIRRTSPPPFMTTFDAGSRDICLVKRSQTNTPLQALNLLNDPQFVEAARVLAERVQRESSAESDDQLRLAFRLVTGRRAEEAELEVLRSLFEEELERFREDRAAAKGLLAMGEYPQPKDLDPARTAALASVNNVLFSMDAAYVRY